VGNANEIKESIEVMRGEGPRDLVEVTNALGAEMLAVAQIDRSRLAQSVADGSALELFARVVAAQGGDPRVVEDPGLLPQAPSHVDIHADVSGYLARLDAYQVGVAAMRLGAGRERKEDTIDPSVGITIHEKPGAQVENGQPLLTLHYRHPARLEEALRVLEGAFEISEDPIEIPPLIIERIESS
jgi:thymidine phosphorylase